MPRRKKRPLFLKSPIPCRNGTLKICLITGKVQFQKYRKNEYRPNLPKYDSKAKCPMWENLIAEVFAVNEEPSEMFRHFHEVLGWILYPAKTNQYYWFFTGYANSGKFQVFDVLENVFNWRNMDHKMTAETPLIDSSFMKTINARNHLRSIPFQRIFTKDELDEMAIETERIATYEISGVLNLILQGLQRVVIRGKFKFPDECSNDFSRAKINTDIEDFFEERCTKLDGIHRGDTVSKMYAAYAEWASSNNRKILSPRSFTIGSRKCGFDTVRSNGNHVYYKCFSLNALR